MKTTPRSSLIVGRGGFTVVELLVAIAVLTLMIVFIAQLFGAATVVMNNGNKHMETDAQARSLLDRMSVDIGAMVKRTDVDYYFKGRPSDGNNVQAGNDQMAFYGEVPGYYTSTDFNSPVSLVAYRLNSATHRIERLGKGLLWNGASVSGTPVVFLPVPLASPLPAPLPSPMPSSPPAPAWPQAADPTATDPDYEAYGPQVFRFEYYYLLKGQTVGGVVYASKLSATPWDARIGGHIALSGLRDVAAIGVAIAVIDPGSRLMVTDLQLQTLTNQMPDFSDGSEPGALEKGWQDAVNASALPRIAASAIRIYGRTFYLNSPSQ